MLVVESHTVRSKEGAWAIAQSLLGVQDGARALGGTWLGETAPLADYLNRSFIAPQGVYYNHYQAFTPPELTADTLAKALGNKHATGGFTSAKATYHLPPDVAAAWQAGGPELRAEIEQAASRAIGTAMTAVVQTHRVVKRRGGGETAKSMVAASAMRANESAGPGELPQLSVSVLVVGVERGDGKLVSPNPQILMQEEARREGAERVTHMLESELQGVLAVREHEPATAVVEQHEPAAEPVQTTMAAAPRAHAPRDAVDPLERHSPLLGAHRAAQIDKVSRGFEEEVHARDSESLRADLRTQVDPFRLIDRAGARATLTNERDVAIAQRAGANPERLGRLHAAAQRLRADGRHLDNWMSDARSAQAGRRIAAQRELLGRRAREIDEAVSLAIDDPSQHVLERLGPRPDRSAPERAEWEHLTEALTRNAFAERGDALLDLEPTTLRPTEQRALHARIERFRDQRGLAPASSRLAREQAAPVKAVGMEM